MPRNFGHAARCRPRTLDERPRLLAPRPDQAVIRGGLDAALGNVGVLVFDALCGEPLEMLKGAVRVAGAPWRHPHSGRRPSAGTDKGPRSHPQNLRRAGSACPRRRPGRSRRPKAPRCPRYPRHSPPGARGPAARGLDARHRRRRPRIRDDHIDFRKSQLADPSAAAPDDLMSSAVSGHGGYSVSAMYPRKDKVDSAADAACSRASARP